MFTSSQASRNIWEIQRKLLHLKPSLHPIVAIITVRLIPLLQNSKKPLPITEKGCTRKRKKGQDRKAKENPRAAAEYSEDFYSEGEEEEEEEEEDEEEENDDSLYDSKESSSESSHFSSREMNLNNRGRKERRSCKQKQMPLKMFKDELKQKLPRRLDGRGKRGGLDSHETWR